MVVSVAGALLVGVAAQSVELRGGKQIEFTDNLELGANWGVQFQIVDGTIGFRVLGTCALWGMADGNE